MYQLEGDWQPLVDQLTEILSHLGEGERLRIGEPTPTRPQGLLRQRRTSTPTRFVNYIGGADIVTAECVGSTKCGGEWPMTRDVELTLETAGWGWPYNGTTPCFRRNGRHSEALWLAEAGLQALELLGMAPADVQISRSSQELVSHRR